MLKITGSVQAHALHGISATRDIESQLASGLPPHTLMARAAVAAAKLTKAIAPHARSVWVACGPGNNGGDGLLTAALLAPWLAEKEGVLTVTWCGDEHRMPSDARWALNLARQAGVCFVDAPPARCDLVIDALLGIGANARPGAPVDTEPTPLQRLIATFRQVGNQLLCLDTPSDLDPEKGNLLVANKPNRICEDAIFTLTFLTIKPGLLTGQGKDAAGEVWFDDLNAGAADHPTHPPTAWLAAAPSLSMAPTSHGASVESALPSRRPRLAHATHKGDFGDVWVVGGQGISHNGHAMAGAALLAARGALHAGAGRVFVVPLDNGHPTTLDPVCPELMFRQVDVLASQVLPDGIWVCGCGGGQAVIPYLPVLLRQATVLVLDADALNAIAADVSLQQLLQIRATSKFVTALTPHPLEAARLLQTTASLVQQDRLSAAAALAKRFNCICVLKGSGTVTAAPGCVPTINPTGNAKLSTAGTGDVLAGMLGAALARHTAEWERAPQADTASDCTQAVLSGYVSVVCGVVYSHGQVADGWPVNAHLSASQLAFAAGTPPAEN